MLKTSSRFAVFAFILSLLAPLSMQASQAEQNRFLNTYKALKKNSVKQFGSQTKGLENHPLYLYLEYEHLTQTIDSTSDTDMLIFMKRYQDSVLSLSMREKWLERLAKQGKWERILGYYLATNSTPIADCIYHEALIRKGNPQGLAKGKAQWMSDKALPSACQGMENALRPHLSEQEYWQRVALAMDKNRQSLANQLAFGLSKQDQALLALWKQVNKNPAKQLARITQDSPKHRTIIVSGIKRMARKQLQSAIRLWQANKQRLSFSPEQIADAENELYARAAKKHDITALSHLNKIPNHLRNDKASLWMARLAARQADWRSLQIAINSLSPDERKDDTWTYWQARAKQALGQPEQSQQLLQSIANNATFHGFLAADKLQRPYHVLQQGKPDRRQQIAAISQNRNIKRALAWYQLGKNDLAMKEWLYTIKPFNKAQKLAAAELALQNNQAFTAILTVAKTKDWNVIDLRFPLLYQDLVAKHSRNLQVDPAWVYGVMRRESAFKVDALSRVKAFGLMQLMPATAKEVSRSLKLKNVKRADYAKPDTNIQLGSAYLSQMLNRFNGNYIKATAAYNAGPGRIAQWAPSRTLAADQWVESIPFDETRKYVKAVLAYTTIYDHLLDGKVTRLSQRLKPITP